MAQFLTAESFDAALIPGFRIQVRALYHDLSAAEQERAAQLRAEARFHQRDCPLCGTAARSATALPRFAGACLTLLRCAACHMVYSAEVLDAETDRRRYAEAGRDSIPRAFASLKQHHAYAALEVSKQAYVVQRIAAQGLRQGRMLDIGCANGSALDAFAAAGWQVAGVEPTAEFAAASRTRHSDVQHGYFPEAAPEGPFDLITLFDLLEHIEQPLGFLEAIRARLRPGGILAVQVPNLDSPLVQVQGAASTVVTFGHWNYFDPASLRACLERAGFVTLGIESYISELDRLMAYPETELRAVLGPWAPADLATLRPADLFARLLGFKLFGLFRRPG
ncbi:class I SAM-dependent methyltransferase [Roseomonas sp. GC11]|uniref:class I SAM-dependent methyltransferase n=1 Tax=Roseomonas sp. GC11 TaxID=2950546 RepID=UPI00210BACA9|nr:class I SAM-dependent methyltransferase [Roseomonas sp. GC11]MCQ4161682.1 class I SAM-dependent methyltransferase [Roseomonas sp. GC11]